MPALNVPIPDFNALPFGAIIGEVNVDEIVRFETLNITKADWERQALEGKAFGEYHGRFCWLLKEAILYEEPIPATGRLGLWEF